jgi:hypothetical protein
LEEISARDVGKRLVVLEVAMGSVAAGVNDALRNALMVEMEDLLPQVEVFQGGGPAGTNPEGILVIGDGGALLRGQYRHFTTGGLMGFAAPTSGHVLIVEARGLAAASACYVRHGRLRRSGSFSFGLNPSRQRLFRDC